MTDTENEVFQKNNSSKKAPPGRIAAERWQPFKMTKYLQIIFVILILNSCKNTENKVEEIDVKNRQDSVIQQTDYSIEFFDYFQKDQTMLKGDSIIITLDGNTEIIQIPQYITRNNTATFSSNRGQTIRIKQINYTDIEFKITYENKEFSGQATLLPQFYFGSETVNFKNGEYLLTKYFVTKTNNPCLDYIGLGNQNIINSETEELYAVVSMAGGDCENELIELTNEKLKKTVANSGNRCASP